MLLCLPRFSDSTLANILSPNSDACGTKFELKVDEVLFVGHPMLAYERHDREFKVSSDQNNNSTHKKLLTLLILAVRPCQGKFRQGT